MELLKTEDVSKSYNGREIIRKINIHLDQGELVSLLGLSGSGKTTLLNILSGLVTPETGHVILCGQDITGTPGKISYMLQKDLLLEHKKVIDNVSLPLLIQGMYKKEARAIAEPFFAQFGLDGTQWMYPSQLSGGMRQRAAFLRTYLGSNAGVTLLDEPFSALDMITKDQMHTWYQQVMKEITLSTLLITHDVDEAVLLSDRVYLLTGTPGEIHHEIQIEHDMNSQTDFQLSTEFLTYKQRILKILKG